MNYLNGLHQTVKANLEATRIGVPVFVRWTASIAPSRVTLKQQLAEMASYTGRWLSTAVHRLYVTGSESQGHLCVTLEYHTGVSAVLALTLAHERPHVALAIYGNHGALYHNEYLALARDGSLSLLHAGSDAEPVAQELAILLAAIEQSLALHRPVVLAQAGGLP